MKIPQTALQRSLSSSVVAAIFILARQLLRERGVEDLPGSGEAAVILAGSSRSQAYTMRDRLEAACAGLVNAPGRPSSETIPSAIEATLVAVRDFLCEHPGAAMGAGQRRHYGDAFRTFVISLCAPGGPAHALTVEHTADAVGVPLGTLKDWLRAGTPQNPMNRDAGQTELVEPNPTRPPADRYASHPDIAVILNEYQCWCGDFGAFCEHLKRHHRLDHGRTFIASVLEAVGLRRPVPRNGRRVPWSKDTFRRLFPGAQWLGDGTALSIVLEGQRFVFNLEAISDVDCSALLGVAVSDAEDEAALLEAFDKAVETAGDKPLAITLDGRPSNHTQGVAEAMKPAQVLPATPARGQAKAGLEGAFGLFAQTAPPLVVTGKTPRERARSTLCLLVTLWAWTRNGKPQRRLGGKSPRDRYQQGSPTPDEIEAARAWIAELRRRHQLALETRARRADPVRQALLQTELARLGIADPDDALAGAVARYGIEAILQGLAIFEAKQRNGTIPRGADPGRYLGGIIRNTDSRLELLAIGEHLLELRQRSKDLTLAPLERERDAIRRAAAAEKLPLALVERALHADATIDFGFWAKAACEALSGLAEAVPQANTLVRQLIRTVACTFSVTKERRQQLVANLTRAVVELR
jgi:hypothetical protein